MPPGDDVAHARGALSGCFFHCFERGKLHATHSAVPQSFHLYGKAYSSGGSAESHQNSLPFLHGREGTFPDCVPPDAMVNSKTVVDVKPGDLGVLKGYHVDEVTHI